MVMNIIVIATCATSLLATCGATADDLPVRSTADVAVVFQALDRNKDQKISRSEASVKGSVSKRFDGIDSNGDGYLSRREFAARPSDARFE
jgi:Ca2+-binding EF-hand superfamily protein